MSNLEILLTVAMCILTLLIIAITFEGGQVMMHRRTDRLADKEQNTRRKISTLKGTVSAQDGRISWLETEVGKKESRISELESENSRLESLLAEQYKRYHSEDNNLKTTDL